MLSRSLAVDLVDLFMGLKKGTGYIFYSLPVVWSVLAS